MSPNGSCASHGSLVRSTTLFLRDPSLTIRRHSTVTAYFRTQETWTHEGESARMQPLSANDLHRALEELSEELRRQGVKGHLYIVGGAAMALSFRASRSTYDLDAQFISGREPILDAAKRIAIRHSWSPKWLNEEAVHLMPRLPDKDSITVFNSENLIVTGASPEFLLSMKMRSARQSDFTDIATLLDVLDIHTADQAFAIHNQVFPSQPLADVECNGLRRIIAELISERERTGDH